MDWWRARAAVHPAQRPTVGNRQLTSLAGVVLTLLLGLVFLTGLVMDSYWHVHYVIGFVLIPVVAMKLASTGYRAAAYYGGNRVYRAAGPPELALRLLAPVLAASTIVALGTGVLLWLQHSRSGTLASLHTDASVVCAGTVGIHFLAYAPRAAEAAWRAVSDFRSRIGVLRILSIVVVLAIGAGIAMATYGSGTWPVRERGSTLGQDR